jgi:hypothetical protein
MQLAHLHAQTKVVVAAAAAVAERDAAVVAAESVSDGHAATPQHALFLPR